MEMWTSTVARIVAEPDPLSLIHAIAIRYTGRVMRQVIIERNGSVHMLDPDQVSRPKTLPPSGNSSRYSQPVPFGLQQPECRLAGENLLSNTACLHDERLSKL